MSRSRDIADFLGKTEIANTANNALLNAASSIDAGLDSAQVLAIAGGLTVYATPNLLPTSGLSAGDQAFVTSNNRIYISNGSGWYNVALINSTPTFTSGPAGSYALATDLTPTVITLVAQDSDGQVVTYSGTPSGMDGIATLSQDSSVFTVTPLTDSAGGNIGSFTITFQATDGIGIASALSTFTLSFGPDWSATPTESRIIASDAQVSGYFGFSVSISSDSNYVIAGARNHTVSGFATAGAAYVYVRSGSTWTQQAKLVASDPAESVDLGYATAINSDGTYAVVGAPNDDTGGTNKGSAYIFVRSGSTWTQQQKIQASDTASDTGSLTFGEAVSISSDGSCVIIGAQWADNGGTSDTGAAYVFTRSGSTWSQQAKLVASDASTSSGFGYSVSINSDATYAAVGAFGDDTTSLNAGAAYIFTRSGSTWSQQQKIVSPDLQAGDWFGRAISINPDGSYVIVGSANADGGAAENVGAAYVFTRSGSTWSQQAKLTASDAQTGDQFGQGVAINSDASYVIIGAMFEDGGAGDPAGAAGAAYIFERSGSTWTQLRKLTSSISDANYRFGMSVGISSDASYVVVGEWLSHTGATIDTGAAYIYEAG